MPPKKAKAVTRGNKARRGVARPPDVAKKTGSAMSNSQSEVSSRAKTPRKAAARGKWSEEQLLTSDKSVLIDLDLVKLLSQPQAWNCLEESEKLEILALLPPDVHPDAACASDDPNAKIPPMPDSFIRYSNNWRDGVRQFQLDLENGRYDPEWLKQAQDARERRALGEFDSFKEREYEEFWGQKQKVVNRAYAGESARVKLGTLISEGIILVGDIWRFYYVYGRGPSRIVVEKEVRIDEINGAKLTFAVPPGEKVFLRSNNIDQKHTTPEQKEKRGDEDLKADLETESTPAIAPSSQEMKDAEPAPEAAKLSQKDEEMKDVDDLKLQDIPGPSNAAMEADVNKTSQEIPTSSNADVMESAVNTDAHEDSTPPKGEDMQINDSEAKTGLAVPTEKDQQEQGPDFSVVIVSPNSGRSPSVKRTIPFPSPQPPVKRKKGRPRKHPLPVQPEPQPEPEVHLETELLQPDQLKPAPPTSSLSLLAAEIEKSTRATAEPSSLSILSAEIEKNTQAAPKPSCPETVNSELPSTSSSPLPSTSQSSKQPEEVLNISIQNGSVEISTDKPESPVIKKEAHAETPIEIDAVDANAVDANAADPNAPTEPNIKFDQATSNDLAEAPVKDEQEEPEPAISEPPPTYSKFPTNEMGEIILSNMSSPAALVLKILQIDGRMPNGRTANAWKELRCYRNNQDMGSLFDVREAWFLQHE